MTKEIPGRKYSKKAFIEALGKVEVKFSDDDEDAQAKQQMEQAQTEDEGTMAAIIEELFNNANRNTDNGRTNDEIDMGGEDIATEGDNADVEVKNADEIDHKDINEDDEEVAGNADVNSVDCIISTTGKKITCRLATIKEL